MTSRKRQKDKHVFAASHFIFFFCHSPKHSTRSARSAPCDGSESVLRIAATARGIRREAARGPGRFTVLFSLGKKTMTKELSERRKGNLGPRRKKIFFFPPTPPPGFSPFFSRRTSVLSSLARDQDSGQDSTLGTGKKQQSELVSSEERKRHRSLSPSLSLSLSITPLFLILFASLPLSISLVAAYPFPPFPPLF